MLKGDEQEVYCDSWENQAIVHSGSKAGVGTGHGQKDLPGFAKYFPGFIHNKLWQRQSNYRLSEGLWGRVGNCWGEWCGRAGIGLSIARKIRRDQAPLQVRVKDWMETYRDYLNPDIKPVCLMIYQFIISLATTENHDPQFELAICRWEKAWGCISSAPFVTYGWTIVVSRTSI